MMLSGPWCYPEDKWNDEDDVHTTVYIHSVYIYLGKKERKKAKERTGKMQCNQFLNVKI